MSVAVSGGYPQYDSSGTSKFIPEIWSGKILVKFYASTVLNQVCNTDWEGEVKAQGDTVHIRTVPDITINDYQKGQNLTNQVPTSTPISFVVDKAKYWSVVIDDVDKAQVDVKLMDMFSSDAAQKMKIGIEKVVFGQVYSDVVAANKGTAAGAESGAINLGDETTPLQVTKANAVDVILDAQNVLDEQNVPDEGRFGIITPWFARMLKSSDIKEVQITGDDKSPLRSGLLGDVDRCRLYVNNNLTKLGTGATAKWHCLFGTRDAVTFASQLTNVESLRAQSTFGDIMRGLNVFGFKTVKGEALVDVVVKR